MNEESGGGACSWRVLWGRCGGLVNKKLAAKWRQKILQRNYSGKPPKIGADFWEVSAVILAVIFFCGGKKNYS
eukprot:scaffold30420_cov160-Skeletonema_dohrnii-CCMP3373.AAC.6